MSDDSDNSDKSDVILKRNHIHKMDPDPSPKSFDEKPLVIRSPFGLDATLFPNGIQPGSLIGISGGSGSGKTFLTTYLLAKFVVSNPSLKAIFIDTASQFSMHSFVRMLCSLLHIPFPTRNQNQNQTESAKSTRIKTDKLFVTKLDPYLKRIIIMSCFTSEDLLFCFGPQNGARLEKQLQDDKDISVIFIDCLNSASFCESLNDSASSIDVFDILKRSVKDSFTPVICVVADTPSPNTVPTTSEENIKPNTVVVKEQLAMLTYVTKRKNVFSHSIYMKVSKVLLNQAEGAEGENEVSGPSYSTVFRCNCSLLPGSSVTHSIPSTSMMNYRVKFSIVSGVLKWCDS